MKQMSGWYFVYLLMAGINGCMLSGHGYTPVDLEWWVWMWIPILTFIAGRKVERGN